MLFLQNILAHVEPRMELALLVTSETLGRPKGSANLRHHNDTSMALQLRVARHQTKVCGLQDNL